MTDAPARNTITASQEEQASSGVLCDETVEAIIEGLEEERHSAVREYCADLQPEDVGELLNQLPTQQRSDLIATLGDQLEHEVLTNLHADAVVDVIDALGHEKAVEAISAIERDDAVQLLEDLSTEVQEGLMESMREEARVDLEQSFAYPEESAGRLMQKRFVSVPEFWTIGNTIDYLRQHNGLPDDFYVIYVVDHRFHPQGMLPLSRIMQSKREARVSEVMHQQIHLQPVDTDQEEVAHVFRKYGLVEAPVVNADGRLVGSITVDDVVYVIQEEDEEDFLKSAGLQSQDLYETIRQSIRQRFPWLLLNLLTAVAASMVIDAYDQTIEKLVVLAVLMPIIASMGGNAGIQSATIAVRALAMKKLATNNIGYMIRKEVTVGALNGLGLALLTSVGIVVLYQDIQVAAIFALATVITMVVAGLSGAGLPFLLQKLGIDPAISSGVFLTMLTDMIGFFTFLGMATVVLM